MTHAEATKFERQRLSAVVNAYTALREAEERATGKVRVSIRKALKALSGFPVRVR